MALKELLKIFKKEKPNISQKFSEFEVNNWEISRFILKKIICKAGIAPFPLSELSLMASTVVYFRPDYIFEWGTHVGKSARIFYEVCKFYKIPCVIHSIDLPDDVIHVEHPKDKRGRMVKGLSSVTLHQGDGLKVSSEIIKTFIGSEKILFFLDGDHSYDSVKRELNFIINNYPQAVILAHDTFYQSAESNYNIGPWKAIQELCSLPGSSYKKIEINMGLPGMTLLYRN